MTTAEQRQIVAQEIGRVLRARREELGLSLEQAAGMADVTANALWLNETGKRIPGADTLIKLAHALRIQDTPLSGFVNVTWEPMGNGLPGLQLVIEAMRTLLHSRSDQPKRRVA